MADPERFDADSDPTFHDDADPIILARRQKKISLTTFSEILQNLLCVIFSVRMRGEG